jgi:uncharacterized protein
MNSCTPQDIVAAMHTDLATRPDAAITRIALGSHLAAVQARRTGLASRVDAGHGQGASRSIELPTGELSAKKLAGLLCTGEHIPELEISDSLLINTLALAAANALLPEPDLYASDGDPGRLPQGYSVQKGQDLLLQQGRGRSVAVVGHFPFVERMAGEFARFWVLEKRPRPGDLAAEQAERVLPLADVVAITSTSISNGTLAGLLCLCRQDAFVLLLGPSTPFAPTLFELGVNALAGAVVMKPETTCPGVMQGRPFKKLDGVFGAILHGRLD